MTSAADLADEQARLWNGAAGHAWVELQDLLDEVLRPFEDALVDGVAASGARLVLDVGCGAGSTTLAIARHFGGNGGCVGVDISAPLIAAAEARADIANVQFLCADAQTHPFHPRGFDSIVSRFGVMFFTDPVRAFANLRRATASGGKLLCFTWRSAAENPYMTTAERAAAPLLPALPPRTPGAPGQFAFADPEHVRSILAASGWSDVQHHAVDVECRYPERDLVRYFSRLGPVGAALETADAETRTRVIDMVREAFAPFVHDGEVRFAAACWRLEAQAG
jgi:SAM-dependent methyltransferase